MNLGDLLPLTLSKNLPTARVERLANGIELRWLAEGVLSIEPPTPGPLRLLLSAGIHGNETAPIELLDRTLRAIVGGRIVPRNCTLVILGNPAAMRAGVRYEVDDLNRLFNGVHQGRDSSEAARAQVLETLARAFFNGAEQRLHYDLHTAIRQSLIERFALYPWQPGRTLPARELQRLGSAGIAALLNHQQVGNTFSAYTHGVLGAESITLELGKARPFGENDGLDLTDLEAVIADLLEGTQSHEAPEPRVFQVTRSVIKHSESFQLFLPAGCQNFTQLPHGYRLAEDGEHRCTVTEHGAHVLFANPTVQAGLRAALLVVEVAHQNSSTE